jgi:alkylated DNA nucleotide flippase Atl1
MRRAAFRAAQASSQPSSSEAVAGSEAFANIKRADLWAARSIPPGKVSTAVDIGAAFNIPARHAAYILSQLRPDEREIVPVHRVVPKDGAFPRPEKRTEAHRSAIGLLAMEGVHLDPKGRISGFAARRVEWPDNWTGTIWTEETDGPWNKA